MKLIERKSKIMCNEFDRQEVRKCIQIKDEVLEEVEG